MAHQITTEENQGFLPGQTDTFVIVDIADKQINFVLIFSRENEFHVAGVVCINHVQNVVQIVQTVDAFQIFEITTTKSLFE